MLITFRSLGTWPRTPTPAKARKTSPFRSTYGDTIGLLEHELATIDARDVHIYADVKTSEIRQDGWLRSGAKPLEPGVVLEFAKGREVIQMPCDTYRDWQDNLRAIALSLQALRAVDRYGVTRHNEQYKGFRALPAPEVDPRHMSKEQAAEFLSGATAGAFTAADLVHDETTRVAAFRAAVRMHHPDRGGDRTVYQMVLDAREVLNR